MTATYDTDSAGRIAPEDIGRVRDATSLIALFEEVTAVKQRRGATAFARCPFHDEKTPSCSVDESKGLYHCFGCGASGDVITFIEKTRNVTFPDAVSILADRAGIQLQAESEEDRAARAHRRRLQRAVSDAIGWYQQQLTLDAAAPAAAYLETRGIPRAVAARFGIGWAPRGNTITTGARIARDVAIEAGLMLPGDTPGKEPYDLLRGRITFPIFDTSGDPVAVAGRRFPDDSDGPKYVNFGDTPLWRKRRILYGLNWAKDQIVITDTAVICEGYTDVIAMHLAGVTNAVASCGTALTDEHIALLARFARRVVMAYDADKAGQDAIERIQGWQADHHLDIAVAHFPDGLDPAEAALVHGPAALADAVAAAQPLLAWRLDRVLASHDLHTPEGRVAAARAAAAVVSTGNDPMLREQYVDVIATRCRVSPDDIRRTLRPPPTYRPTANPTDAPAPPLVEYEALRLAVLHPERVAEWIAPHLFADSACRAGLDALFTHDLVADAVAAGGPAGELIARCDFDQAPLADTAEIRCRLVVAAARRTLSVLAAGLRTGGLDADDVANDVGRVRLLADAASADPTHQAVDQLIDWLAQRAEDDTADSADPAADYGGLGDPEEWL